MATGCARVNLGTAALENPDWTASAIDRYGDRVAVGLDVRGTTLAARGWTKEGGDLWEVLARLDAAGCARYVVTDVNKDGMLNGPNLELLAQMCAATKAPVVASGGVSSLADIEAHPHPHPVGRRGRDRGQGAVQRQLHAAAGARRRGPTVALWAPSPHSTQPIPHPAHTPPSPYPTQPSRHAPVRHPGHACPTSRSPLSPSVTLTGPATAHRRRGMAHVDRTHGRDSRHRVRGAIHCGLHGRRSQF